MKLKSELVVLLFATVCQGTLIQAWGQGPQQVHILKHDVIPKPDGSYWFHFHCGKVGNTIVPTDRFYFEVLVLDFVGDPMDGIVDIVDAWQSELLVPQPVFPPGGGAAIGYNAGTSWFSDPNPNAVHMQGMGYEVIAYWVDAQGNVKDTDSYSVFP